MADPTPVKPVELADLFRRASRTMARMYHRRDHAHHAQDHVLSILRERGPMNQGELLALLDVRSSSMSEILRKLEDNGLITRQRDERDRRSFIVSPTEQARARHTDRDSGRESADSLFACLDHEERTRLQQILEKLIASLTSDMGECGRSCGRRGKGRGMGSGNGQGATRRHRRR